MRAISIVRHITNGRLVVMNTDDDGCIPTLTTAHHYAGNIIAPRQGFREVGVMCIYESD